MTRKEFFKKLGIGAVIAVVVPKVIAETKPQHDVEWREVDRKIIRIKNRKGEYSVIEQMEPYINKIQMDWLKMQVYLNKLTP